MTTFLMTRAQYRLHLESNRRQPRRVTPSDRRARLKRIARFRRGK